MKAKPDNTVNLFVPYVGTPQISRTEMNERGESQVLNCMFRKPLSRIELSYSWNRYYSMRIHFLDRNYPIALNEYLSPLIYQRSI